MSDKTIAIIQRNSQPLEPIPTGLDIKLERLSGMEAIMFDIYGTLFISGSGDVGHAAANPTLESLVSAGSAIEVDFAEAGDSVLESFYETIRESHRRSKAEGIEFPEVEILEIWRETLTDYQLADSRICELAVEFESRSNPVWPMPFLKDTLLQLKKNFPMGIISNAQFFTVDLFEALLDEKRGDLGFDAELEVFSYAERNAKPGKAIFETAVKRLAKRGIRPEKVLYVGNDMLNDIRGAQLVGFRTALFAGDRRSLRLRKEDERVDGIEPDIIVNCLSQIPECLN